MPLAQTRMAQRLELPLTLLHGRHRGNLVRLSLPRKDLVNLGQRVVITDVAREDHHRQPRIARVIVRARHH